MSGQRNIFRRPLDGFLATSGNTESARTITEPIYEGLVVDAIVDYNHPEYAQKDGYNVGCIKVRIFSVDHTLDEEQLSWADPFDLSIQEIPLIGELVVIHKIRGNFFYTRKVAIARRIQENGMLNLNASLNKRLGNTISTAIKNNEELTLDSHRFGEYFKPDNRIRPLKHFEGDLIFQGRMGHSIRFGSSQMDPSSKGMAPNIILRAGQAKDNEKTYVSKEAIFGITLEDINKDASSIWMVADQVVPFEPITRDAGSFVRSVASPPQMYDKAQIIINSDRLVLNAKKTHIMLFANEGIHLNSFKDATIDTDSSILLTANIDIINRTSRSISNMADSNFTVNVGNDILTLSLKKTSFLADKIYVGSQDNDDEPLVGGQTLAKWLNDFINAHLSPQFHVLTSMGPGKLHPQVVLKLKALQKRLKGMIDAEFNSEDNFVMLKNEEVKMELNEFEGGEQLKTENSKWILGEPYYKVQ